MKNGAKHRDVVNDKMQVRARISASSQVGAMPLGGLIIPRSKVRSLPAPPGFLCVSLFIRTRTLGEFIYEALFCWSCGYRSSSSWL